MSVEKYPRVCGVELYQIQLHTAYEGVKGEGVTVEW